MTVQTNEEITRIARNRRDLAGVTRLSEYQRRDLQYLACACGYPFDRAEGIEDAHLRELLKAALKSAPVAIQVCARIARANGVQIDASVQASALPDILSEPVDGTPKPAPPLPPFDDTEYVTPDTLARVAADVLENAKGYAVRKDAELAETVTAGIEASIPRAIAEALKAQTATNLIVTLPGKVPEPLGLVHRETARIIRALNAGLNVYLHGPAGSGKTTVGRKCADAFGLPFYTAAKVESEYLLLGFRDAKGDVVRTPFREAYEHGGVFLFDELDASSPGAIVALNMALANGVCPFPDGLVMRHENFRCIAAGNTVLTGANRQYAGRNQMDAASVDRFYFIEFGYDETLEIELASNKEWAAHVQAVRAAVKERGLTHLVTPRATLDGCKALDMGDTWEQVEQACIFKGLDRETVEALRAAVGRA